MEPGATCTRTPPGEVPIGPDHAHRASRCSSVGQAAAGPKQTLKAQVTWVISEKGHLLEPRKVKQHEINLNLIPMAQRKHLTQRQAHKVDRRIAGYRRERDQVGEGGH